MKIGRIPKREMVNTQVKTPFDLIDVKVGALKSCARPYEFNDLDTNPKPIKAAAGCPHCGHSIFVDLLVDKLVDGCYVVACTQCGAGVINKPKFENPFIDPVAVNAVNLFDKIVIEPLGKKKVDDAVKNDGADPSPDMDLTKSTVARPEQADVIPLDDDNVQDIIDLLKSQPVIDQEE